MISKYSKKDVVFFFLLYIGAIISVYLLPAIFSYFFFAIILVLFFRSRKNALWIILCFFMIDPPGGLFPNDYNYGLPFMPGLNIRFVELFVYTALIKALRVHNKFYSVYNKSFQYLMLLTLTLLIYTLFLNSFTISILITLKWLFIWTLIYSIPKLISTSEEWVFLFKISFIIVFIAFLSQLLHLALGYPPSFLLGTNFRPMMEYGQVAFDLSKANIQDYDDFIRPISSSSIILISFVGAMYFQQIKKDVFQKNYLNVVLIISYLSILLTATRGWIIAFTFIFFIYFTFIHKVRKFIIGFSILLVIIPVLLNIPLIHKQLVYSFERISTLESVAHGDLSAGGTNSRDQYSIELIKLWKENPLLGWGFSDVFKANENGHAGVANLLFSVGVIGFIVFIYFWFKLFSIPIIIEKNLSNHNPYKGSLIIFSLAFLTFFILNATSGQQFGIYLGFGQGVYAQILYYSFSSFFIVEAIKIDKSISQSQGG